MPQIATGDRAAVARALKRQPGLARVGLTRGATRAGTQGLFLDEIGCVLYAGDTALHVAAAAYDVPSLRLLLKLGASVHATNRRGATPLHSAAVGGPDARHWNPKAQVAVIEALIAAGAVAALLTHGADPRGTETLVRRNTGRSGSGSAAAKAERAKIAALLGHTR